MQNGLQLNPRKSEALVADTANQLCVLDSSASSVDLSVAEDIKALSVVLAFHKHDSTVVRSCNYHAQAIRILLTELACSPILSRIDYCNAVLHGAPIENIQKLQRVQNKLCAWRHNMPPPHPLYACCGSPPVLNLMPACGAQRALCHEYS